MRSLLLFILLTTILLFSYVYSQDEPSARLVLTIQQGKQSNNRQSFQVNSGEAVFIPIGQANLNVPTPPKPDPQELAYQNARGQLSQQIANKIADVQSTQQNYDNESYLVYKAPLELSRQRQMSELRALESERAELESRKIFTDSQKAQAAAVTPQKPSLVPQGIYVKPTISDDGVKVSLNIRSQGFVTDKGSGEISSTIELPVGQWAQVPNQDMWIKVDKGAE